MTRLLSLIALLAIAALATAALASASPKNGRATLSDISITKVVDKSSPVLFK